MVAGELTRRTEWLRTALDAIAGTTAEPSPVLRAPDHGDAWSLAVASYVAAMRLEHDYAARFSREAAAALPASPDRGDPVVVLTLAALGIAAAGTGVAGRWDDIAPGLTASGDPVRDALPLLDGLDDSDCSRFAHYALAEAALALGRVGIAGRVPGVGSFERELAGHPFDTVIATLRARIAAFGGRMTEAQGHLAGLSPTGIERLDLLADATRSFVDGNTAHPAEVRALAARLARADTRGPDRIDSGCALLCGYGLLGVGDIVRSAELIAGHGWERAVIIDRAIVHELLVHAAIRAGDLPAAEAWLAAALEHFAGDPIADSTLDRARSRLLLAMGDAETAIEAAERSIHRAREEGRTVEEAEGEILVARARIAAGRRGEALRDLGRIVETVEPEGFRAVRLSAGRELRGTGRRLPPPRGRGRDALSARELQVLGLLVEGRETAEIATALHISPHTARVHVSRVLTAFGVASRVALVCRLATEEGDPAAAAASSGVLTSRQHAVVGEVARGFGNTDVAEHLGIAVRTVEKHLTEAMRRLGVTTRVALIARTAGLVGRAE
ncbi:MAG: helix-turn-helix transcriptional regulator [Microbacteriaceae bacterium]|nr:helix-turn-helix transcriptional regulator [Microbacteriaceae bacterium]